MSVIDSKNLDIEELFVYIESDLFQPDLSNSPLGNYEKQCLTDKIKQMHCQSCFQKGFCVPIALDAFDFEEACVAEKVYLSTVSGDTIAEIFRHLDTEWRNMYSNAILNLIFKEEPTMECLAEILEKLESLPNLDYLHWGVCIGRSASTNYCIELITYS